MGNTFKNLTRSESKSYIICHSLTFKLRLGVAIVVSHDVYEWSWRGFIIFLGYLAIIKGIARIGFPKHEKQMAYSLIKGNSYWITFLIVLVIGIWLAYTGFNLSL